MTIKLESIFRCDDQSALIHNNVASEDPPPGAWSFHSGPQSPLGRVTFPEILTGVVTIGQGLVYTAGKDGILEEHTLTGHRWLPWLYEGTGQSIRVQRAVTKDLWIARVQTAPARRSLLVLQCQASSALKIDARRTKNGLLFSWNGGFDIEITFSPGGGAGRIQIADDPLLLKRRLAGFDDVKLNEGHCLGWAWQQQKCVWLGVEFRGRIEARFAVVKHGATGRPSSADQCRLQPKTLVSKTRPVAPRTAFPVAVRRERTRWERFFDEQAPPFRTDDPVLRDIYYFGWQTLWSNRCEGSAGDLRRPFTSPARLSYGAQWWWDEAFHSIAYRHLKSPRIAYEGFENFWYAQKRDGAIPGNLRMTTDQPRMTMQPPMIGPALQMLKDRPGWPRNVRPMYESLLRMTLWHLGPKRDTDRDGLAEYHHCFDGPADQSQRWDSQKLDASQVIGELRPTESVDFNVWMSIMWQVLGEMAERLGKQKAAADHARRARRTMELVERFMWDERDGFYYDIDGRTHRKIRVKTPYNFMPLLSPFARRDRVERIVHEHIFNPREFWCEYPLPSVSLDNPTFDPRNMFRGPSWVQTNWLVIEGLARQGFQREAARLAHKTLELVGPRYRGGRRIRSPRFWEWYNPHTGEPLGNSQYSWSAGLTVDLILRFAAPRAGAVEPPTSR